MSALAVQPLVAAAAVIAIAYLLGSVSGSLWVGRLRGVDIRQHGSGNAGGTNALRTQGWRFALAVVVVDIGKGALAAWLGTALAPSTLPAPTLGFLAAGAAVLGHVWPLWHGFRGGKGAATAVGALLVLWPAALPWLLLAWVAVIVGTGYVGLATVLAAATLPLQALAHPADTARLAFAAGIALFLAWTHRGNLARLRAGNEARFERARLLHRWRARRRV